MQDFGWNPVTQVFNVKQVPREIKNVLQKAGFRKKFLKQKETALDIYEFLLKNIDPQSETGISSNANPFFLNKRNTNLSSSMSRERGNSGQFKLREHSNSRVNEAVATEGSEPV
jgi:hypothetical protein